MLGGAWRPTEDQVMLISERQPKRDDLSRDKGRSTEHEGIVGKLRGRQSLCVHHGPPHVAVEHGRIRMRKISLFAIAAAVVATGLGV
jgi:hypothetical protein